MTENILLCKLCIRLPAWGQTSFCSDIKRFLKRDVCLVIRLHCQTDCKSSSVFWNVEQLCERGLTPYPSFLPSSPIWLRLQLSLWQAVFPMPNIWHSFKIRVLCLFCRHSIMCRRFKSCGRKWVFFPLNKSLPLGGHRKWGENPNRGLFKSEPRQTKGKVLSWPVPLHPPNLPQPRLWGRKHPPHSQSTSASSASSRLSALGFLLGSCSTDLRNFSPHWGPDRP